MTTSPLSMQFADFAISNDRADFFHCIKLRRDRYAKSSRYLEINLFALQYAPSRNAVSKKREEH